MSNSNNGFIVKESVLAVINSETRLNPNISTSSSFTYSFNDKIDRITEVTVKNVQIPYTFYVFDDDRAKVLTFNNGTVSVTIPPAIYTTSSLEIVLKALIDTAFGDTTTVVTFNANTQLMGIRREFPFKIDLKWDYPLSTASFLLGFVIGNDYVTTAITTQAYNLAGFSANNTNTLIINPIGAYGTYYSITIAPGNYTTTSLSTELKSKIDTAFGDTDTTVVFSNVTYKLTITRTAPFYIASYNEYPESTASKLLGFITPGTFDSVLTGDSMYNISGPNYILLRSRFLVQASNRKAIYINNDYKDVLAVIPLVVSAGDIISIPDNISIPIHLSYKWTIKQTDIIDITLTDENGNILDLNGAPMAIQLSFTTD